MADQAQDITTWGGWAVAVMTAAGGLLFGWMKQRQSERKEESDRDDSARKDQVQMILTRLEVVEQKKDNCEERLLGVTAEVSKLTERSKQCEEDRQTLSERIRKLEDTLRVE
jgi:chromosome segregation ATPase